MISGSAVLGGLIGSALVSPQLALVMLAAAVPASASLRWVSRRMREHRAAREQARTQLERLGAQWGEIDAVMLARLEQAMRWVDGSQARAARRLARADVRASLLFELWVLGTFASLVLTAAAVFGGAWLTGETPAAAVAVWSAVSVLYYDLSDISTAVDEIGDSVPKLRRALEVFDYALERRGGVIPAGRDRRAVVRPRVVRVPAVRAGAARRVLQRRSR